MTTYQHANSNPCVPHNLVSSQDPRSHLVFANHHVDMAAPWQNPALPQPLSTFRLRSVYVPYSFCRLSIKCLSHEQSVPECATACVPLQIPTYASRAAWKIIYKEHHPQTSKPCIYKRNAAFHLVFAGCSSGFVMRNDRFSYAMIWCDFL